MRSSRSTSRSLYAALVAGALSAPASALAQPCCSGATALTPGRLALHEQALAGIGFRLTDIVGSFDPSTHYVGAPSASNEVDVEQDLIWTVRVAKRGQVSLLLPIVETWRRVPGQSELGGGFGDANLGARYDFTDAGSSTVVPGIAALAVVAFPTGVPPDAATKPLATDATGVGAYQGSLAIALEQTFGSLFADLTGSLTLHASRTVGPLEEQRGVGFAVSGAGGWSFDSGLALAASLSYTSELAPDLQGLPVPNGARSLTQIGFSGGYPFSDTWRAQGAIFGDLPWNGLGQNQPAGIGFLIMGFRTWT